MHGLVTGKGGEMLNLMPTFPQCLSELTHGNVSETKKWTDVHSTLLILGDHIFPGVFSNQQPAL